VGSSHSLAGRIKRSVPRPVYELLRVLKNRRDVTASAGFLFRSNGTTSFVDRARLLKQLWRITMSVECAHTQAELLDELDEVFRLTSKVPGVMVEAGCFKGGSTAKFSLAAQRVGRRLYVFDSFAGMPSNTETQQPTPTHRSGFPEGSYAGAYDEVAGNVRRFGAIESCRFVKGWFEDTLPHFDEKVAFAYIDVDLASSTRTCLKFIYPRLSPGGIIISQDGHIPMVRRVIGDPAFWRDEVGCPMPEMIEGLGVSKLVRIRKPASA
jgi:O-methyltransferase